MIGFLSLLAGGLLLASPSLAQTTLPLPLVPSAPGPVAGSVDLELDAGLIGLLSELDAVRLEGFPNLEGALLDLELTRVAFDFASVGVFVDGARASWDPGDLSLWKGRVAGLPGSEAFLAFSSRGSYGWVDDGAGRTHLTATSGARGDWAPPGARIYTDAALLAAPGGREREVRCLVDDLPNGPRHNPAALGGGNVHTPGQTLECKLAVETDYQLYQIWNDLSAEQSYVMALLAAKSDRYLEQVDIKLTYPYVMFYTSSNDPWQSQDSGGNSIDLLYEFRDAWAGNIPGGAHLAHFVSGAGLGGGVAWLDVLCNSSYGFAVSGNINGGVTFPVQQGSNTWDFMVTAHETGHNVGTPHTHDYCPPLDQCAPSGYFGQCQSQQVCTSSGTIMSYCHLCSGGMSNITTYFHPTVVGVLRAEADASCLPDWGGGGPVVLFADDFESGDFAAGGWTVSDAGGRTVVAGGAAHDGSFGARLKKGGKGTASCLVGTQETWIRAPSVSTLGYGTVELHFWAKCNANELGCENVDVQWWNGSSWESVTSFEDQVWLELTIPLPAGAANNPGLEVRLITNMKGKLERLDLDGFEIVAS